VKKRGVNLVQFRRSAGLLLLLHLVIAQPVYAAAGAGLDVVTMRNGDIHHGTVSREYFSFRTAFGDISVPNALMAQLQTGNARTADRLVTRSGDTFRGRVLDEEITMLRILETALPLKLGDVAEITFGARPLQPQQKLPADAVETRNGDQFLAHILLDELVLRNAASTWPLARAQLHLVDFAVLMDGEQQLAQALLNGGRIHQGQTELEHVRVETHYGQTLEIPVTSLTTLAFGVNYRDDRPDFNYRRVLAPAALIHDRLIDGTAAPELIALRGGTFTRGDARGDLDEQPATPATLKPFAIGIYELTFDEYDRFCDDTRRNKPDDSGWGRGRNPVINVSWEDAVAYTEWLSRQTRHHYRLPTDTEWEYAARGGTQTRFWWGDEPGIARANCEGCGSLWDGDRTALVGRFPPNPFGLHDSAGNVFEWVADCYHNSLAGQPADGTAFEKPDCGKRVIRGGAWSFPPAEARSANRWRDFPSRRSDDTGFRVVRELTDD